MMGGLVIDGHFVGVPEALAVGEVMHYTTPKGIKVDIKRGSEKMGGYDVTVHQLPGCLCSCPLSPQIASATVGGLKIQYVASIVQDDDNVVVN